MPIITIPRTFGGTLFIAVITPPTPVTIVVARGRDGIAVAQGRDGLAVARGRDGKTVGRGR